MEILIDPVGRIVVVPVQGHTVKVRIEPIDDRRLDSHRVQAVVLDSVVVVRVIVAVMERHRLGGDAFHQERVDVISGGILRPDDKDVGSRLVFVQGRAGVLELLNEEVIRRIRTLG